jgi:hypothetical protein
MGIEDQSLLLSGKIKWNNNSRFNLRIYNVAVHKWSKLIHSMFVDWFTKISNRN